MQKDQNETEEQINQILPNRYLLVVCLIGTGRGFSVTQWIGEYEVLEPLGEGGMGVVYRGREPSLNKTVAIKVLHPDLARNKEGLERFRVEALLGANFRHPNCIHVEKLIETETCVAIIMDFVDGITVKEFMRLNGGRLPVPIALKVFSQVLSGIDYAHQMGVLHRDIKPSNILVERFGLDELSVKVMDFGIAKVTTENKSKTSTDARMGTLLYMSPEHVMSPKYVDVRSDIYSLGATFFEMITGSAPFDDDVSSYELMERIVKNPPPLPSDLNPEIPRAIELAILKAMAKRPDDRFQSCTEFKRAFKGEVTLLDDDWDQVVAALSDMTPDAEARFAELSEIAETADRSKRRLAVIAAFLILILGAGIIGGTLALRTYWEKARQAEESRVVAEDTARQKTAQSDREARARRETEQELAFQQEAAARDREEASRNERASELAAKEAVARKQKLEADERDRLTSAIHRAEELRNRSRYQEALNEIDDAIAAVPSDVRPQVRAELDQAANLRGSIRANKKSHEDQLQQLAQQQAQITVLQDTLSVAEEKIRAEQFPEAKAICDTVINNPEAPREIRDRASSLKKEAQEKLIQAISEGAKVGEVSEQLIKKKKKQ